MTYYFATVAKGLEPLAAKELTDLGAKDVTSEVRGVRFAGDRSLLYRANLWGRFLFRVLVPIAEFPCNDAQELYQGVYDIEWLEYLKPEQTLAVSCTGGNVALNHTHFSALQVKNAIADLQREQTGRRSSVDTQNPDLLINLYIYRDRGIISLDSSGDSLHRRGYRPAMGVAPLKETLAAALLELTEWDGTIPLFDPLCGSGTIILEAGLKALNIAPGLFRSRFGFENWRDFDRHLWEQLKQEAREQQLTQLPAPIWGSDRDQQILAQTRINAEKCGLGAHLHLEQKDFEDIEPPSATGILICNPPHGQRLGEVEELGPFYKQIGDILKQRFKGWTAYIFTNKELGKKVGLKASRRFPLDNGSLPCTLLKYELY